ncbi:MAG: hypothetical protein H0W88_12065 [Parachlamydiaceae bacterium]|nr:hypothetical protein [Parachlamydiaceae bacterium]
MNSNLIQNRVIQSYNTFKVNSAQFFSNRNNVIAAVALSIFSLIVIGYLVLRKKTDAVTKEPVEDISKTQTIATTILNPGKTEQQEVSSSASNNGSESTPEGPETTSGKKEETQNLHSETDKGEKTNSEINGDSLPSSQTALKPAISSEEIDEWLKNLLKNDIIEEAVIEENDFNQILDGEGTQKLSDGTILKGTFKNGLLEGKNCIITYPNGTIEEGEFSKGSLFYGIERNINKDEDGAISQVTYTYEKGILVKSEFNDCEEIDVKDTDEQEYGANSYIADGCKLVEGTLKNGLLHGKKCKIIFEDGSSEEGTFSQGLLNGKGLQSFKSGMEILGKFVDGELVPGKIGVKNLELFKFTGTVQADGSIIISEGIGEFDLPNGDFIRGKLLNGMLHDENGYKMTAEGDIETGEFQKGLLNGKGKITRGDGLEISGNFEDGQPVGMVEITPFGKDPYQVLIKENGEIQPIKKLDVKESEIGISLLDEVLQPKEMTQALVDVAS